MELVELLHANQAAFAMEARQIALRREVQELRKLDRQQAVHGSSEARDRAGRALLGLRRAKG